MRKYFLVFILFCAVFSSYAQSNGNSPYSRFGFGDLVDESFFYLRHMGNIGTGFADHRTINMKNPASYSYLKSTSFDVGMFAKNARYKDSNDRISKRWSGNLGYMAIGFPLVNPLNRILDREESDINYGMIFALKPRTRVNYSITAQDSIPGTGNIIRNYSGNGGTYDFTWGTAIKYKDLSFGVNLAYVFGNIEYQQNVVFSSLSRPYNNTFATDYNIGGFTYDIGMMYEWVLNKAAIEKEPSLKKKYMTFGLSFGTSTGLTTRSDVESIARRTLSANITILDTLEYEFDKRGKAKLPGEFGIGATYYSGYDWAVGVDYRSSPWSKYYNDANKEAEGSLVNSYKMSIGGYYRPNYKSYNSYFKRVYYKFGALYEKDPRVINNNEIDHYAVTFGLGLPFIFQRKISHANLGIELGKRGQNTPIQEDYIRLTLGFNFSDDEWFLKRKYN